MQTGENKDTTVDKEDKKDYWDYEFFKCIIIDLFVCIGLSFVGSILKHVKRESHVSYLTQCLTIHLLLGLAAICVLCYQFLSPSATNQWYNSFSNVFNLFSSDSSPYSIGNVLLFSAAFVTLFTHGIARLVD